MDKKKELFLKNFLFEIIENKDLKKVWLSIDLLSILTALKIRKKQDIETALSIIFESLKELNNNQLNILIPSFSFSFPIIKKFNTLDSQPDLGSLPKYLFSKKYLKRTLHPFYSFYVFGIDTNKFLEEVKFLNDSVGSNSIFNYLNKEDYKLLSIGHHFSSALSSIHQTEFLKGIQYRSEIKFSGELIDPNREIIIDGEFNFFGRKKYFCDFSGITMNGIKHLKDKEISQNFIIDAIDNPIGCYVVNLQLCNNYLVENHGPFNILFDYEKKPFLKSGSVVTPEKSILLYKKFIKSKIN